MRFAQYLHSLRTKAGLTKTELAAKMGWTLTTVIKLEAGQRKPPDHEKTKHLADILMLSAQEKNDFFKTADEERLSDDARDYIRKYCAGHSPTEMINGELTEALKDPEIKEMIKCLKTLPRDKLHAIKALICK